MYIYIYMYIYWLYIRLNTFILFIFCAARLRPRHRVYDAFPPPPPKGKQQEGNGRQTGPKERPEPNGPEWRPCVSSGVPCGGEIAALLHRTSKVRKMVPHVDQSGTKRVPTSNQTRNKNSSRSHVKNKSGNK